MRLWAGILYGAVSLVGWFTLGFIVLAVLIGDVSFQWRAHTRPYSEALVATIKVDEGFRAHVYVDTTGNPTIGYGWNINDGIVEADADYLLRAYLDREVGRVRACWPAFDDQPIGTRSALLDLGYQVGAAGLCAFDNTLAALERGDCDIAQAGILDSAEARETPGRASRVAAALCP